jgi:methylated-DNA-protein-cysteine methyltransferase-like protein
MFPKILSMVRKIPRGKVATYGAVARAAGYAGAARQVVWALRSPGARGAPWHRVLGAGGRIRLPGASGFEQRLRLQAEGVAFHGERVDMKLHEWQFGKSKSSTQRTQRKKGRKAK